jgi:hypothetical protein
MPEAGGPTTQSGIYCQNTITALYLGQLLGGGPATLSVRDAADAAETRLIVRRFDE